MKAALPGKPYPVSFSVARFSPKHLLATVDLNAAGSPAAAAAAAADLVERIEKTGLLKWFLYGRSNLAQLTARQQAGYRMEIELSFEPSNAMARLTAAN